jgi:hypothetical protein
MIQGSCFREARGSIDQALDDLLSIKFRFSIIVAAGSQSGAFRLVGFIFVRPGKKPKTRSRSGYYSHYNTTVFESRTG